MEETSAADSACSRRSSAKRSLSWPCICRSACTSASTSGTPERGKRGGEPAAMARAAAVMAVSGWAMERPAISAKSVPTSSASSAAPATAPCARLHDVVHLLQARGHPDHAGTSRHGDVEQVVAHRLAPAGGDADAAGQGGADLGAIEVILQRRERALGEVAVGADGAGPGRSG